jgi:hypothetical protein
MMIFSSIYFHSSLWLSYTPLCICAWFFLIHSSVEGHLGWFHSLAILNSAGIFIIVRRYLSTYNRYVYCMLTYIPLDICPDCGQIFRTVYSRIIWYVYF